MGFRALRRAEKPQVKEIVRHLHLILGLMLAGYALPLLAQEIPEGMAVPRYATEAERMRMPVRVPWHKLFGVPPTGNLHTPAEYDPMEGILLAYEGTLSWKSILDQLAANITTLGDADVYVMADDSAEAATIMTSMGNAGADLNRVHTLIVTTDTIWIRDYGPRYVYEGGVRVIVDHTYNRPRPNDNLLPSFIASVKNHARYEIPLVHGGGNYHLHATGIAHTTRLINNENPGLTEGEIHQLWMDYQNLDTQFYNPFPTFVDSTQHIDMWMQAIGDFEIMISDWPFDVGSTQDQICDAAASDLAMAGYTVHRIPARSVGGTHYTYTNVVMCNDLILLPMYTQSQVVAHNNEALTVWQTAMPGKTVVQVNAQDIVTAAGVFHCIVMHLPVPLGGANPTVYLKTRPNGDVFMVDDAVELRWISDDDVGVAEIDLWLSLDGGANFDTPIATGIPNNGIYLWTVPDVDTTMARLRIVARDGDENTGSDETEFDFTILGTDPCPGDVFPDNGDGTYGDGFVDNDDLLATASQWGKGLGIFDVWPDHGDGTYGDGVVDVRDILFVMDLFGACP